MLQPYMILLATEHRAGMTNYNYPSAVKEQSMNLIVSVPDHL